MLRLRTLCNNVLSYMSEHAEANDMSSDDQILNYKLRPLLVLCCELFPFT
jgi:hypothetical protein